MLRVRAVLGCERGGVSKGREKSRIPSTPTRCTWAGTPLPLPPPPGIWKPGAAGPDHCPHLPPGGPGKRGGDHRAPGRGAVPVTSGSAGAGIPAPRVGPQVRAAGWAGSRCPGKKFLGLERCNCVQLFLVFRRPRAAGAPFPAAPGEGRRPGGRRRQGCGRGGASPRGGAAVSAGSASGILARARAPGSPWYPLGPDKPTAEPAAAAEPGGAAGGRTEAEPGRPGWVGAGPLGEGPALRDFERLLKSEQLSEPRAATGRPRSSPLVPRRNWGSFLEFVDSHVFKFL